MSAKGRGPSAHSTIRRMRNVRLGWTPALGELIDNSCGNGATTVTVRLTPTTCEVRDDGNGCTEEMFGALQSLGWHQEDSEHSNPTSVYGIGSKDAVIWAGGPTEYYSVRDAARISVVDWDSFGESWTYQDPVIGKAAAERCSAIRLEGHGTVIRMPHHTRQINRAVFDATFKALASQHWAAVETGVVIRVEFMPRGANRQRAIGGVLPGKPLPLLIDGKQMDAVVSLADGRTVRIVGGVLDSSVRMSEPGFEYIFGHRVVVPCGGLGAGQLCFERVYFRVFLLGDKLDWQVTTNKLGLHDSDEAALGEAVFRECKHLLEHAQNESIASLLEKEVEDELSKLLSEGNRRRKKSKDKEPSPTPPESENDREQRKRNPSRKKRGAAEIKVKLTEFDADKSHLLGSANVKDRIVRLNKLHPAVSTDQSRELLLIAYSVWSDAWTEIDDRGNRLLLATRMTFVEKFSSMLAGMKQLETSNQA